LKKKKKLKAIYSKTPEAPLFAYVISTERLNGHLSSLKKS